MIALPAIGGLAMLSGGIFFLAFDRGQKDFRTVLYLILMLIWSLLMGLTTWYFDKNNTFRLQDSFAFLQILIFLTGVFHLWWMYAKLFWSKRNPLIWAEDSFWAELLFTFLTSGLVIGGIMGILSFAGLISLAEILWPAVIWFLIPFLFVKTYDFLTQIPQRDYRVKWTFLPKRINEEEWPWVNEMWINFEVRESWNKRGINRLAKFRILAPRAVANGEVFRLGLRVYNQKGPEIVVQDMGFEPENSRCFWWLFSLKFIWNRPHTWFPNNRWINPYDSSLQNGLRPNDVILARRIAFNSSSGVQDNGDVAIGEY